MESVLNQSFREVELIIVDDGSSDRSLQTIERFAERDARIHVLSRENTGIVGALNEGLSVAKYDFVARMDADDVSAPERFRKQYDFLADHPRCVAVGTSAWIIDPKGRKVGLHHPPTNSSAIEERLLVGDGGALLHPSAMIRRSAIEQIGGYRQAFNLAEDLDLYFRLLEIGELANIDAPLLFYRQHANSTNFRKRGKQRVLVKQIIDRERRSRAMQPQKIHIARGPSDLSTTELYFQWACEALAIGCERTAVLHALNAIRRAPLRRRSWQILKYVVISIGSRKKE